VTPTAADGPLSPVDYLHTANEIGLLLGLVGRGTSLRRASEAVRLAAGRFVPDDHGMGHASRECGLAARYVDLFGATLDRELAPRRWPTILVLDARPKIGGLSRGSIRSPSTGTDAPARRCPRRGRSGGHEIKATPVPSHP
jgi:hypothetical protein